VLEVASGAGETVTDWDVTVVVVPTCVDADVDVGGGEEDRVRRQGLTMSSVGASEGGGEGKYSTPFVVDVF
jgi:hypothetical protein